MTRRLSILLILLMPSLPSTGQVEESTSPSAPPPPIFFTDITQQAGIDFRHSFGDQDLSNIVEGTGPGVAVFDYNGDTFPDLYFLNGAWLPDERRLEIDGALIRMSEARALLEGELERTSEHYRIDLTAKLPPTDCNAVVGAIPEDFLGSLARF